MSDTKASAMVSAAALGGPEVFPSSQSGNSRGVTATQIQTFVNASPVLAAGDATHAAATLTSGTVLTTAAAGAMEYDGNCFYGTSEASNRGIVPVTQFIVCTSARTFVSDTNQQAIFNSPAAGTLTLGTGTYIFECGFSIGSMSATSGNGKWSLIGAGTATLGSQMLQLYMGSDLTFNNIAVAYSGNGMAQALQGAANLSTATTSTDLVAIIRGSFTVTGAGTLIPSFAQTTAAAAVVRVGSYFTCTRVGSATVVSVGNWS